MQESAIQQRVQNGGLCRCRALLTAWHSHVVGKPVVLDLRGDPLSTLPGTEMVYSTFLLGMKSTGSSSVFLLNSFPLASSLAEQSISPMKSPGDSVPQGGSGAVPQEDGGVRLLPFIANVVLVWANRPDYQTSANK